MTCITCPSTPMLLLCFVHCLGSRARGARVDAFRSRYIRDRTHAPTCPGVVRPRHTSDWCEKQRPCFGFLSPRAAARRGVLKNVCRPTVGVDSFSSHPRFFFRRRTYVFHYFFSVLKPFKSAVPFWGQSTHFLSSLSPTRES